MEHHFRIQFSNDKSKGRKVFTSVENVKQVECVIKETKHTCKENKCKKRTPRNRSGCFCCRKRKIKCDGRKPVCVNCVRGSYKCEWPANGDESLSHHNNFKLVKIGNNDLKLVKGYSNVQSVELQNNDQSVRVRTNVKFIDMNTVMKTKLSSKQAQTNMLTAPLKTAENTSKTNEDVDEDALIRRYIRESIKDILPCKINGSFGFTLDKEELLYYDAFVNGFIVSISNQLAHQKLLPGSIIIPVGISDPLIRKLCLTCGASFLHRCNNSVDDAKIKKTNSMVVKGLIDRLTNKPIMETREWILIYFILRNARQKFYYEGRNSQTINLISGIQAIKLWIETKKRQSNEDTLIEEIMESDTHDDNGNVYQPDDTSETGETDSYVLLDKLVDKLNMLKIKKNLEPEYGSNRKNFRNGTLIDNLDIEANTLISSFNLTKSSSYANNVSAFERTLLETFIFNYSGTLLTIDKSLINCIPSPFEVFEIMTPLLSIPIFNCAVPWMNNPTAGAALPMIELQAKIIWLSFFRDRLSANEIHLVESIQKIAKFYTRPIIPDYVWTSYPRNVSRKLLESCYISEIVAKGVYLFSLKVLNDSLDENEQVVRDVVDSMLSILKSISLHSQTSVIAKWAFIVIGCAIKSVEKRDFFRRRLLGFIDALKTGSLRTTLIFLETVWSDQVGLDALFIEKYLDLLVI